MITREEFNRKYVEAVRTGGMREGIWSIVEADQAQYTALVDAAVAIVDHDYVEYGTSEQWIRLKEALQPFLKPLLSEKLDKLADDATALVDAAVAYTTSDGPDLMTDLIKAVQPFLKPLLSEELDRLADESVNICQYSIDKELRQFADRARELEKHRRNGVSGVEK